MPATDFGERPSGDYKKAIAVDISTEDHTFTPYARAIRVVTTGALVVRFSGDAADVTLTSFSGMLEGQITQVTKTGTTAAAMHAFA